MTRIGMCLRNQAKGAVDHRDYIADPAKSYAHMQHMANLREYRKRAGDDAYWGMVDRIDKGGEPWQAVDVDICRELERLDCQEDRQTMTELRTGG